MNIWKKRVQRLFGRRTENNRIGRATTMDNGGSLTPELVGSMVQGILSTRPDELDCDECFVELDMFAEVHLVGKNAAEALPLVQDHLNRCKDCREEFEALLLALQATP